MDAGRFAQSADPSPQCAGCSLRPLCVPEGLMPAELRSLAELVAGRRRVARRARLVREGDPFVALHVIRSGSVMSTEGGEVCGFHFPGDALGLEGLGLRAHACELVALEETELCVVRRGELEALMLRVPRLQGAMHALMGGEIVRAREAARMLGAPAADGRVAAFLVGLARRLGAPGRPAQEVALPMTRAELGSFLGLQLETVSRALSRLQAEGILEVKRPRVTIRDPERLAALAGRGPA